MRAQTGRLRVIDPATDASGTRPRVSTVGAYIRLHRERQDLTLEELAAATKIPRSTLMAIEADETAEMAPVFVKGFLRCCARVLSLDEDTVMGLLYETSTEGPTVQPVSEPVGPAPAPASGSASTSLVAPRRPLQQVGASLGRIWDRLEPVMPSSRVLMWIVVSLLVIAIVLAAFSMANGQADALPTS